MEHYLISKPWGGTIAINVTFSPFCFLYWLIFTINLPEISQCFGKNCKQGRCPTVTNNNKKNCMNYTVTLADIKFGGVLHGVNRR